MPYPNFHAARVADPNQFETCRTKIIDSGVSMIICKKKASKDWEVQAYRFNKENFTVEEAKKWLEDHDVKTILFEPSLSKDLKDSFEVVLKKIEDAELSYNWNQALKMFINLKEGKEVGYIKDDVVDYAAENLKEIIARRKIKFDVKNLSDEEHQLIIEASKQFVKSKLNVENPHGFNIYEGKETALLLGEDEELDGFYLLVQNGKALGFIRFGAFSDDNDAKFGRHNYRIDSLSFDKYKEKHQVTDEERQERWGEQKFLYLYPIQEFFKFDKPIML